MSSSRLRHQAEMCARLASFMSDPNDRARLLKTEQTFLEIAAEQDGRLDCRKAEPEVE